MHALEISQLRKTYASGVEALKGIDLSVNEGDFFALLGANGAGKSTSIGLIATLLRKTSGKILINGYDIDKNPAEAKTCLGLMPQEINLNVFETCLQILVNQAGFYGISRSIGIARAEKRLEQLGLWDKRNAFVRTLSGGMKRRLMIARALIHEPKLLILDEPTAGVDVEIRRSMWSFFKKINQEGTTIILTTHYLEEAEHLCKNVAIIDKGQIIINTSMQNLLATLHRQSFVFNTEDPIKTLPLSTNAFELQQIDGNSFEARLSTEVSLNDLFAIFNNHGLKIQGMRNKTNRLEELFMDLISHDH